MYSVDKIVEDSTRSLLNSVRKGRKILDYLKNGDLSPSARQEMEKELERVDYQMQAGIEFVRAYKDHLKIQAQAEKQPVAAPAPQVEYPTLEAQLVA